MTTAYAIGDIHGHLNLLEQAHALIEADAARHGAAPVVHVGDLVDRGPASRGVVQYLLDGMASGRDWVVLKGNHDRLFTRFFEDPWAQDPGLRAELSWLHPRLGGGATLASYGVANAADRPVERVFDEGIKAVPLDHLDFLRGLPLMHRLPGPSGDLVFVHAGIRPGVALEDQLENDLVWIREPFLSDPVDHGFLVIHGHTALDAATAYGNRINLDSGAAYGGPLSAVAFEGREAFLLTPEGRVALPRG